MTLMQANPTEQTAQPPEWLRIITTGAAGPAPTSCAGLTELAQRLQDPSVRVVVLYRPAGEALAGALLDMAPDAALAAWQAACETLLDIQRRNRGQIVLIEAPGGADPDQAALEAFGTAVPGADWPQQEAPSAQAQALAPFAALVLERQRGTRQLIDELQAASHGPYTELEAGEALYNAAARDWRAMYAERKKSETALVDLQTLLSGQIADLEAQLRADETRCRDMARALEAAQQDARSTYAELEGARKQCAEKDAQSAQQKKQNALLASQIRALQAQAEDGEQVAQAQAQDGEQAVQAARRETRAVRKALDAALAQCDQEKEAARILAGQVADLQETLRRSDEMRGVLKHEKLQLDAVYRRRVAALSEMLNAVYASTSWRITQPARSVMRRIRG